jgi:hypothetical protein
MRLFLSDMRQKHHKGRQKKKKKKKTNVLCAGSKCTYVLYLARIELLYTYDDVLFFIAFLTKNALKKNR